LNTKRYETKKTERELLEKWEKGGERKRWKLIILYANRWLGDVEQHKFQKSFRNQPALYITFLNVGIYANFQGANAF
jgi:hypothetical protein